MMSTTSNVGLPTSSIMTGLLTQRKRSEFKKNTSQLFVRETPEGQFYRLRLLNITPDTKFVNSSNFAHYRDFPFIIQHIHTVWQDVPTNDPEKPIKKVNHTIVCPQTDYVKANSTLSKAQCPMCNAYGAAWKAFSDSHYKNQEAKAKMKLLHNTLRVLAPVYVVNDPNHEANNGSVRVLSLDEDAYQALLTQINASAQNNTPIWGQDACDLFFTWGKVEKVKNEGKQNEYRFQKNGFTRIGFTTAPKHLDNLTDELVDDLQFDANWYQVPTKEELEQFYLENFSATNTNNDDIPMDIPAVAPAARPAPGVTVNARAATPAPAPDPIAKDVTEDVDNLPPPAPAPAPKKEAAPAPVEEDINARIDDILAGMIPS